MKTADDLQFWLDKREELFMRLMQDPCNLVVRTQLSVVEIAIALLTVQLRDENKAA